MNRLWVRLAVTFAVVVLAAAGIVSVLAGLSAGQAFRAYVSYSGALPHQTLIDRLAEYYQVQGTWQGVEWLLDQASMMPGPVIGMRRAPRDLPEGPFEYVLADATGIVVYDGPGREPGRRLTHEEQAAAQDIAVDDQVVGQLIVAVPIQPGLLGPLEEIFMTRLQRWLVVGALSAGGLGVLLGLILSRSLTAPLSRLAGAARAIATRDFSRRVPAEGSDEMIEVAHAFNDMAAALESSERHRQQMVADVAHELRNPLTIIQGNLRAILDDVYPLEKAEVTRLYDETRLLGRLVDDLRELALADAGQLHLNRAPVDVAALLDATAASMTPAAEMSGIAVQVEPLPHLPAVSADRDRIAQVLRNLLANALRHTPPGGTVTLSGAARDGAVEITVADTGEGIDPADLPHIFDRFWRADRARTRGDRPAGSSGLGLSIAQSLVRAHGGRLWAESQPGAGATFRFTLPTGPDTWEGR
ncbi:MAG: HAMP domain-containing histidine kinase [Anaerolineae bacterium]|nr:HAMP domain-containing histidine kinase [Anaerolineae bacterium]